LDMIEVKIVNSTDLQKIRFEVLWPHLNSENEAVIDIDFSTGSLHLAGILDGEVVGVASLFVQACDRYPLMFRGKRVYRLRAMGVKTDLQKSGIGAAIINEASSLCSERGFDVIWCDARIVALGFYSRMGFDFACDSEGNECDAYQVRNIGLHKMMYKYI